MRYAPVLCLVLGMIAAACASHPSSQGRTAGSPALASSRPETFLVHHTEGSVIVSVDPAVPSARLAAVFGVTGIPPGVFTGSGTGPSRTRPQSVR